MNRWGHTVRWRNFVWISLYPSTHSLPQGKDLVNAALLHLNAFYKTVDSRIANLYSQSMLIY
ncbi:MAG: hypothetical protein CMH81_08490 [Nitrospiraceae bacterium]|nr:hypothetical protein [Nitrospiraceae bacterium]